MVELKKKMTYKKYKALINESRKKGWIVTASQVRL